MIADHLSRMEKPTKEEIGTKIEENFLDEQLFQVSVQLPWYANIANYLSCGIIPPNFSYKQKRKQRTDARVYIWDDLLLFRRGVDQIIRKCVPEDEQGGIIDKCLASPYGGYFAGERTTQKIL